MTVPDAIRGSWGQNCQVVLREIKKQRLRDPEWIETPEEDHRVN